MSKQVHPFDDVKDIPNVFYFLNTTPSRYDASDYFRTFRDLHTSKKHAMHEYWKRAIYILIASSALTYQRAGNRLLAVWKSHGKGLKEFWAQQERLESQDNLQATTTMVRKRSYRSLRHHLFQAFNAVDDNTIYEGQSSKRRLRSAGITGSDEGTGGKEKNRQEELQRVGGKDERDEEGEEEQSDDGDESGESASQSSEGSECQAWQNSSQS